MPLLSGLPVTYKESVASRSPGSAGFALDAGRCSWPYYVDGLSIYDALVDIMGVTDQDVGDGRLKRKLPRAHPWFPWCYAERVSNIQGVGKPITFVLSESYECPLLVGKIALYRTYLLSIEFLTRPYQLFSDEHVTRQTVTWTNDLGLEEASIITGEYGRFVDYDVEADTDIVTAQHGTTVFRSTSDVNGKSFTGMPRVYVPKQTIKLRWFGIPFRYVESSNSYLARYQNYINQGAFFGYPEGSLLYKGFRTLRRYPPPVPDEVPIAGSTAFSTAKLCDVEIVLEYTGRTLGAPPPAPPANANWLVAGHNLFPHFLDRKFYYVTANNDDPLKQYPMFPSFPMALLFTDPDYVLL